jgi:3-deoxy-D-manno-octulosonic-acid transferase
MLIFYQFFWSVLLLFLIPAAMFSRSDRLRERLALKLPAPLEKDGNIWVHALSVGEVLSALPLIEKLKTAYPDKDIVFSATTRSGMSLARDKLSRQVACIVTLPVDAWWCVRRFKQFASPALFVLVETDLWPGLLTNLKQKGIPSLLVNGRISPRTHKGYQRAPGLVRKMFEPLSYCLMQTDLDRDRLLTLGMDPKKVLTVGNIKFEREMKVLDSKEKEAWRHRLGLSRHDQIWLAGSTHAGEENLILKVYGALKEAFPSLRLIIAPRDVGRSLEIKKLAVDEGLVAALRTHSSENKRSDVIILDTVGELGQLYDIGTLAFVGGSLVPIGGHNPLEPAESGIPVIFGPHTHNFELMSESILKADGAVRVQNDAELLDAAKRILTDSGLRERLGRNARSFVRKNRGALDRIMKTIDQIMAAD